MGEGAAGLAWALMRRWMKDSGWLIIAEGGISFRYLGHWPTHRAGWGPREGDNAKPASSPQTGAQFP